MNQRSFLEDDTFKVPTGVTSKRQSEALLVILRATVETLVQQKVVIDWLNKLRAAGPLDDLGLRGLVDGAEEICRSFDLNSVVMLGTLVEIALLCNENPNDGCEIVVELVTGVGDENRNVTVERLLRILNIFTKALTEKNWMAVPDAEFYPSLKKVVDLLSQRLNSALRQGEAQLGSKTGKAGTDPRLMAEALRLHCFGDGQGPVSKAEIARRLLPDKEDADRTVRAWFSDMNRWLLILPQRTNAA